MKVLWLTNIPSPYRVNFFSMLGEKCDLTVIFERAASSERDSAWKKYSFENFKGIILNGINTAVDSRFCPGVLGYIHNGYDAIIISDFLTPTGLLAIAKLKAKHIPFYLESDGGFYSPNNKIISAIKRFAITGAKGYFSTGEKHDEYYIKNGADPNKIIRYPFSSVYAKDVLSKPISLDEKLRLRRELGIPTDGKVIISAGQFIHRKGFDILLKAVKGYPWSTYVIGGVPTQEYLALADENAHFLPFMKKNDLFKWFFASDAFVLPTRYDIWGLVVNEAMACGLPVISTDTCLAGLEMVKPDENGYLLSSNTPENLRESIDRLFSRNLICMSSSSLTIARQYTIETMVLRHLVALNIE